MPKGPILSRLSYFTEIRGSGNPGNPNRNTLIKQHEYNTVETELGTMVEPRSFAQAFGGDFNKIAQIDLTDNAANAVRVIDEGEFQSSFGTGGAILTDYNA